jgi:hypothetical protein
MSYIFAGETGDKAKQYHFDGDLSLTNNGFATVPSFSLGKPAAIAVLDIGGERFTFEPKFRFNLEDMQPWAFVFIWRYQVVKRDRFNFRAGLYLPAIAFQGQTIEVDGNSVDQVAPARAVSLELMPAFNVTERIEVRLFYLTRFGDDRLNEPLNSNFISLQGSFSRIPLAKKLYVSWDPQFYYLNVNRKDGFYTAHSFEFGHREFPVSIGYMMNITLKTELDSKDFDWNISLIYSFSSQYVKD